MNFSILRLTNHRSLPRLLARGRPHPLLFLACWLTLAVPGLRAQQAPDVAAVDKQTLQLLFERIDQLEARVRQLEADKQQAIGVHMVAASAPNNSTNALQVSSAPAFVPASLSPAFTSFPAPANSFMATSVAPVQQQK